MRLQAAPFLVRQITTGHNQLHGYASRNTHDPPDRPWQRAGVVGAASLPARAWQDGADRVDQAHVRVGDDQLDTGQASGDQ
jgi:hypothetical protein